MKKIESKHLVIMQEIVEFLQERGWDITELEIRRYNEHDSPFIDHSGEEWKEQKSNFKWYVSLSTAPADEDNVKVPNNKNVSTE